VTITQPIPAMAPGSASTICASGDIILSGGCLAGTIDSRHVLLSSAPFPADIPIGWSCVFHNGTAAEVTSTATVLCLKPAP
jgi:hypothetical protein